MRTLIPLSLIVVLIAVSARRSKLDREWEEYKIEFDKTYESPVEEEERRLIWERNLELITKHNEEAEQGLSTFTLRINPFSDMSEEEFAETHTGLWDEEDDLDLSPNDTFDFAENTDLPSFINWREMHIVTPIKSQLHCGSGWAFAAVAALESQHAWKTGKLVSLSEQNLLDCVGGKNGCDGGRPSAAFRYIRQNRGIATEESYPYVGKKGECRYRLEQRGATLKSFRRVYPKRSELALQRAVATVGPIVASIHANNIPELASYGGGIFNFRECIGQRPDHAVVIVGYGTQDGTDYWLIKNSWGERWGVKGYLYLARNIDMCGISRKALYPIV